MLAELRSRDRQWGHGRAAVLELLRCTPTQRCKRGITDASQQPFCCKWIHHGGSRRCSGCGRRLRSSGSAAIVVTHGFHYGWRGLRLRRWRRGEDVNARIDGWCRRGGAVKSTKIQQVHFDRRRWRWRSHGRRRHRCGFGWWRRRNGRGCLRRRWRCLSWNDAAKQGCRHSFLLELLFGLFHGGGWRRSGLAVPPVLRLTGRGR
mmetsp:Transcript_11220/g.32282  ORF Transcript_11220/g.32282 Transcript_11220/m.32282 type:complete len:204 (-) Transcript_11220:2443-3054(-)